jgi:hypothetical protein
MSINEKIEASARHWYPVFLATQEREIKRIEVQSLPRQIVLKTLFSKYPM